MFAKLFIVALAVAAVAARPGVSSVVSYSSPVVSAVAPAVVASRTYHGVAAPAYSTYSANYVAAPAAYTAYSAPHAYTAYSAPHAYTYGAYASPVAYSAYAAPYTTVY